MPTTHEKKVSDRSIDNGPVSSEGGEPQSPGQDGYPGEAESGRETLSTKEPCIPAEEEARPNDRDSAKDGLHSMKCPRCGGKCQSVLFGFTNVKAVCENHTIQIPRMEVLGCKCKNCSRRYFPHNDELVESYVIG